MGYQFLGGESSSKSAYKDESWPSKTFRPKSTRIEGFHIAEQPSNQSLQKALFSLVNTNLIFKKNPTSSLEITTWVEATPPTASEVRHLLRWRRLSANRQMVVALCYTLVAPLCNRVQVAPMQLSRMVAPLCCSLQQPAPPRGEHPSWQVLYLGMYLYLFIPILVFV